MRRKLMPLLLGVVASTALAGGRAALVGEAIGQAKDSPGHVPSYEEIRPLLEAKCVRCHGGKRPKAELDLSTPAGILKGGESGPAIVAGKPGDSRLYEKIHSGAMPPAKEDRLGASDVERVHAWIKAGAKFGSSA